MRIRWKAAALILPVLAGLVGCGRDATAPNASAARPRHDIVIIEWPDSSGMMPDTVAGDGGYYGSGHRYIPPEEGDSTGG
jgi:hypothetical protein